MKNEKNKKSSVSKFLIATSLITIGTIGILAPDLAMAAVTVKKDGTGGIGDVATALSAQGSGIQSLISMLSLVAGGGLMVFSLISGYLASKPQSQTNWSTAIYAFIFGALLLSIGALTDVGSSSLGLSKGTSTDSVFAP